MITELHKRLYDIATKEIGQKEINGTANNQRIIEYHKATSLRATTDEVAWCSSFINWCVKQLNVDGTNSAAARSWLKWVKEIEEPILGCIVVLKRGTNPVQGHVALYSGKMEKGFIYLLGGNQSDSVNIQKYKVSDVLGYRVYE